MSHNKKKHHKISELKLHLLGTFFVDIYEIVNLTFLPDLHLTCTINCRKQLDTTQSTQLSNFLTKVEKEACVA